MTTPSEREFLQLAGTYLACRWCVMGGLLDGQPPVTDFETLGWHLLGMVDYGCALRLFAANWKVNPQHSERYNPPPKALVFHRL